MGDVWDAVSDRYSDMTNHAADFNTALLSSLRPRWSGVVRPDTSMFTLLFTRPTETGYQFTERVEVLLEDHDRVRMALVRDVPRKGLEQPGGRAVVAGDFTRPENALRAVEALLHQLAEPNA